MVAVPLFSVIYPRLIQWLLERREDSKCLTSWTAMLNSLPDSMTLKKRRENRKSKRWWMNFLTVLCRFNDSGKRRENNKSNRNLFKTISMIVIQWLLRRREDRNVPSVTFGWKFNPHDSMTLEKKRKQQGIRKSPIILVEVLLTPPFLLQNPKKNKKTAALKHPILGKNIKEKRKE